MTNKEQIEVIKKVKANLNKYHGLYFLCPEFVSVMHLECSIAETAEAIAEHIPLFTKENAQQFADPNYPMDYAWWIGNEKERRMQFLNWMLDELALEWDENELPEDNFIMGGF